MIWYNFCLTKRENRAEICILLHASRLWNHDDDDDDDDFVKSMDVFAMSFTILACNSRLMYLPGRLELCKCSPMPIPAHFSSFSLSSAQGVIILKPRQVPGII